MYLPGIFIADGHSNRALYIVFDTYTCTYMYTGAISIVYMYMYMYVM